MIFFRGKVIDKEKHIPDYDKLFRRIDTNGDGNITINEFKIGLKKLKYSHEKEWNKKMIKRLFNEIDKDKSGIIEIKELIDFINDGINENQPIGLKFNFNLTSTHTNNAKNIIETNEDDLIFTKYKIQTETDLFSKINQILQDMIPYNNRSNIYNK